MRCMQLQQDLAAAQGGGGADREELSRIDQQIADADRAFQGTQAAMESAGCFESFFIFGRGLVRSPKCLAMNDRVEGARRDLTQLQQQRQVLAGGGGNRRQQAELQDALARAGCGGQVRTPPRRGGLFDFFGIGRDEEEEQLPETPISRSIDPNGRYRSVCVRLCDGFFYPIHYSTYGSLLAQDAQACQANCAAPAELYVYRNPGQEIEQAVSLNGSAYLDLPVALRFRKEYVKGCSCKQVEYNPTDIEAANKEAAAAAAASPTKGKGRAKAPLPPASAPQATAPAASGQAPQAAAVPAAGAGAQISPKPAMEVTGSNAPPPPAPAQAAVPPTQKPPAPPAAAAPASPPPAAASAEQTPPPTSTSKTKKPPAPPAASSTPPPPPAASASTDGTQPPAQSVAKRKTPPPPPQAASPFGPQY
jgi:Protein of unknown function (DUF2865)